MSPQSASLVPAILLLLILYPQTCLGGLSPVQKTVLDSLSTWHKQSRPDLVDSLASASIPAARAKNDSTYLLQLLRLSGSSKAAFGMVKQAEPDLVEACLLAEATKDTLSWLQGLRWLSVSVGRQGRSTEAVQYYQQLGELAHANGDSIHMGWAKLGLAYDQYLNGHSEKAIDGYRQAAEMLDNEGVTKGALWAYNGLGMSLRQIGQFEAAVGCFKNSLDLAIAQGDKLNEAMALNYIGRLEMILGDPGIAIKNFQRAASIHEKFQHHREGLLPLLDIAQARTMQGRFTEATLGLETVISQSSQWGLKDMELLAIQQLADIHLAQNQPYKAVHLCRQAMTDREYPSAMAHTEVSLRMSQALAALDSLEQALAVLEPVSGSKSAATTLELRVNHQRAQYLLALNRPQRALDCALAAIDMAQAAGSGQMLIPLQTMVARAWFALGRQDSALAAIFEAADQWERTRAIPADPRWRELRSAAGSELFTEGAKMMIKSKNSLAPAFDFVQRYKARTLTERVRRPGRNIEAGAKVISSGELQSRMLLPGVVFWEVVATRETSVFFLVTRDTIIGHILPDGPRLEANMQRLSDVLTSQAISDPNPARILASTLVESLPPGFKRILGKANKLVWSPDGIWHGLPLTLLRAPLDSGLISDQCEVSRLPCASFLKSTQQRNNQAPASSEILVFQGPSPNVGADESFANGEVDWLKSNFRNVRTETSSKIKNGTNMAWSTTGLIHIATHTEIDDQQPWNTSILLASNGNNSLEAADVAELTLKARLAVLASCSSAGSRTIAGEGMLGLTSAFLASGVQTVVATLWPVDDRATSIFMIRFYTNLADGHNVSSALGLAQNQCQHDSAMESARYWAGFVVVGDGSDILPVQKKSNHLLAALILVFLAACSIYQGRRLSERKGHKNI